MQLKNALITNLIIICLSIILSIIFNNYSTTYTDGGITGWFNGGNTPSMILSILCPLFLLYINKNRGYIMTTISYSTVFFLLYSNGTRTAYYSLIITFGILIAVNTLNNCNKNKILKVLINVLFLCISVYLYPSSFTYNKQIEKHEVNKIYSQKIEKIEKIENSNPKTDKHNPDKNNDSSKENKIKEILSDNDYKIYCMLKTSFIYEDLINRHGPEIIVEEMRDKINDEILSDNRFVKRLNAKIIFNNSSLSTKIFGINFHEIAKDQMDMENDISAIFYYFGYFGFAIYVLYLLYFVFISLKKAFRNIRYIFNPELIVLAYTFALCTLGGEMTGAFLRKPNANLYLAVICALIYYLYNKDSIKRNIKNIKFLNLHLGYGGIETATINSANALSSKYNVEIVSLYNLEKNQEYKLNDNISVKYLCRYIPNKQSFMDALQKKKVLLIIKEGIKSAYILFLKRVLIIKEIFEDDSDAIISTRIEFTKLLNKYGNPKVLKISQEHKHHNNDKKYIKMIKNELYNIDYLFALTKNLKEDYEKFLIKNHHTEVVLMPNMLEYIPTNYSKLNNNNLITISRLDENKNVKEMIDIVRKLNINNWHLTIIGDGTELENLKKQTDDLKLNDKIDFTGFLSKEEIEDYLLNSTFFLMTSKSEALPMVLLEAMSYGLPCIAYETDSGINDIIMDNKNGFVIERRNQEKFVNRIESILNKKHQQKKFSQEAIKTSQKFSSKNILQKWKKILK